jgi:AbrB family looped-hinge helix DNA binding protein
MAKVTSKLQLTVPKAIAEVYGIRPGDELEWTPAGETIRVVPARQLKHSLHKLEIEDRLRLFDQATERQRRRETGLRKARSRPAKPPASRGWKREDLYRRGLPG